MTCSTGCSIGWIYPAGRLKNAHGQNAKNSCPEPQLNFIGRNDDHRRTIDEIIGDALLVIFGAPIHLEDHPLRAAACALEMQLAMREVNRLNRAAGFPELAMGIGINTGDVVVGNIGSSMRAKYGVVGPNVNLTGRIESFSLGGQVLASEGMVKACGPVLKTDRHTEFSPKGMSNPIQVYRIMGISGGGYDIALPVEEPDAMVELNQKPAVSFKILQGKDAGGNAHVGTLLRVGRECAEIGAGMLPESMTNLKILLLDECGLETGEALYGKVTGSRSRFPSSFMVEFTSIPGEVQIFVEKVLAGCL